MAHPYKNTIKSGSATATARYADGGRMSDSAMDEDSRRSREVSRATKSLGWGGSNPPVTVMEDFIGRFDKAKAQSNSFRDALREREFDIIKRFKKSGGGKVKR